MQRRNCRFEAAGRRHVVAAALTLSLLAACAGRGQHAAHTLEVGPPAAHPAPAPDAAPAPRSTVDAAPGTTARRGAVVPGDRAAPDRHGSGGIGPCTGPRRRVACALEAARDGLYRQPGSARTSTVFVPGTPVAAAVERDLRILRHHRAVRIEVNQHLRLRVTQHGPGHFTVRVDETLHADRVIGPGGAVLAQRRYGPAPRRFSILYTRGGPYGYRIADVTRVGTPVVTEL